MPDDVTADRVSAIAAAARVPLASGAAERIAQAVTPTVRRFAAGEISYAFEAEPLSFVLAARRELDE